jgi:hypothetical protein
VSRYGDVASPVHSACIWGQLTAIAKQQSTRLKTKLSALGVEIKHTQALEGIAANYNHNDCNSYLPNLFFLPQLSMTLIIRKFT